MRVLGFDPGTATTGYGVVEGRGTRLRHIAHGTIATPAGEHFADRLKTIYNEVDHKRATRLNFYVSLVLTGISFAITYWVWASTVG